MNLIMDFPMQKLSGTVIWTRAPLVIYDWQFSQ